MDIWVLDTTFQVVGVLDSYKSFIWTDRYCGYGDFEIYAPADNILLSMLQEDYYLWVKDSDRTMIIETIEIETDAEEGATVTVSGRSLESILERRIIRGQTVLEAEEDENLPLQEGVEKLLNENLIKPNIDSRKIEGFKFKRSEDETVVGAWVWAQYFGENLYDAIVALCESFHLGFRVLLDISSGSMEFELYSGQDRSYEQMANPHIIFSPGFENLLSSNYLSSKKAWKNAAMVAGEGEGAERILVDVSPDENEYSGLDRRELFVDAESISKTVYTDDGESTELSTEDYEEQLKQKGNEELQKVGITETFEGEIASASGYTYGSDFFLGDIVEIVDEFGHSARARVTEIIMSHDESGSSTIPTFSVVD